MELKLLRTFLAVASKLSFHGAARELNYAQSSVSAHIAELERELGVRLFERLGRRILLSQAGEALLPYATKMLHLDREARGEVSPQGQAGGSLTIRVPESFCALRLPPAIAAFHAELPGVGLNLITCAHEGLEADLRKGVTDLAFLLIDTFSAADLEAEVLGVEPLVVLAHPGHELARRRKVRSRDLAGRTWLLSRVDCSYRRLLSRLLAEEKAPPGRVLEFHSVRALLACVAAGVGLTVAPRSAVAGHLRRGELKALAWPEGGLEAAALMIHHRDKWLSPALGRFMDCVRRLTWD